jgi:hypothetical protein
MHWRTKQKLSDKWQVEVFCAVPLAPLRRILTHDLRPKRATVTLFHSRFYDRDNAFGACKVVFDALKRNGFIVDDAPEWLTQDVKQEKCPHKKRHTVIELEAA